MNSQKKIMTSEVVNLLTQNLMQLTAIHQQYGMQLDSVMADISEHKQRTEVLEIKFDALSGASDYCTVRRYCKLKGIKISNKNAQSLGRLSAKICRKKGYPIAKVEDDLYVQVNSYPIEVLDEVSQLLQLNGK